MCMLFIHTSHHYIIKHNITYIILQHDNTELHEINLCRHSVSTLCTRQIPSHSIFSYVGMKIIIFHTWRDLKAIFCQTISIFHLNHASVKDFRKPYHISLSLSSSSSSLVWENIMYCTRLEIIWMFGAH